MKILLSLGTMFVLSAAGSVAPGLKSKVRAKEISNAILELPQVTNDLIQNQTFQSLSGDARASAVAATLQQLTAADQASYIAVITSIPGLTVEQYWVSNVLLIEGLTEVSLDTLVSTLKGDFLLREQFTASVHATAVIDANVSITQNPQWGVAMIRAPAAWRVTQGQGCIVNIVDSGVNLEHEALKDSWAGGWHDSYYSTPLPTDVLGHGTHVAGVVLARLNGVGVAPASRWIACRGLNHQGSATEAALLGCAQWSITTIPRPHVSVNAWGGNSGVPWYDYAINAIRNAGIIPVFAIGNSGSSCRTVNSPGDRPNNIAVGATTTSDTMATFSSRGPNSEGAVKPEVSAPGQNIVSCGTGSNNYVTMSGTSMATPHVAGAVCLLLSANPGWGFLQILNALIDSAAHPTLSNADRNCGLPSPGQDFPNYAWGFGRIDVGRALGQ